MLLAGCGSGHAAVEAPSSPAASASPTASPTATVATATGRLSASEKTWLDAAIGIQQTIDSYAGAQTNGTTGPQALRALARAYRGCTRELSRIGTAPTTRLQPVYALVVKACEQYDKAAGCAETAAQATDVKKANRAADCVAAGALDGGKIMAEARVKNIEIRTASGDL